jgi:hypothetical protein
MSRLSSKNNNFVAFSALHAPIAKLLHSSYLKLQNVTNKLLQSPKSSNKFRNLDVK